MRRRSRPPSRRGSPRTSWSNYATCACCWAGTSAAPRKGADKVALITRLALRLGAGVLLGAALLFGPGLLAAPQVHQALLPASSLPGATPTTPPPTAAPRISH